MKYSNHCPNCGAAGYIVSAPGDKPVYRCTHCSISFGVANA